MEKKQIEEMIDLAIRQLDLKSIVVAKVTAKILFIFLILTPPGIETLIMCFQNTIQNLIYNYMMSYAN